MNIHVPSVQAPSPSLKPTRTAGALILGGSHGALAAARSLGRHGIPVWLISCDLAIGRFSRYVSRTVRWLGPDHPDALKFLLDLGREHGLDDWVLFAASDADARFLARHSSDLTPQFRSTVAPWATLQWADDKRLMNDRAAAVGIDIPWSATAADADALAKLDCPFPLVMKPSVHLGRNAFTQAKAWRIDDRAALKQRFAEASALVGCDGILLQQLIPGSGTAQFSYAAVWDRGRPVASLVARRARQFPIDFGYTSTYVEPVVQRDVEDAAIRFLATIGYHGLVEIEFKFDARDGRYKILDANPRIWTWIGLGAIAGVDFPWLMWCVAMNKPVPPVTARTDVAWMHGSRDVIAALQEIKRGVLSPARYLASLRKHLTFAAGAADDAWPGLIDLPLVALRFTTRRLKAALFP